MLAAALNCALAWSLPGRAGADVFQWEWVDPNDHSQGKQQSSMLCPDGAGRIAAPGSVFDGLNLTQAYLFQSNLTNASWFDCNLADAYFARSNLYQMLLYSSSAVGADFTLVDAHTTNFRFDNLTGADFTDANLQAAKLNFSTLDNANFTRADFSNASLGFSTFHNANFTDAIIAGVKFNGATQDGFTQGQLHQTASYKNHNLRGIGFGQTDDLSGWDLSGGIDLTQSNFTLVKLNGASFNAATLTNSSFLNAKLVGASFSGAAMSGCSLEASDLSNANFANANLSNVNAEAARWTGANLSGAIIAGADLDTAFGLTAQQVYSTASYQNHDLRGTDFSNNDMTGWSFRGVNLSNARMISSRLAGADFSNGNLAGAAILATTVEGADFSGATITGAELYPLASQQLYSTASYLAHDLRGVVLSGNDMRGWDFSGQNMTGAVLDRGTLHNADFTGAVLTGARLYSADLRGAHNAILDGTSMSQTILPDGTVTVFIQNILAIHNYVGSSPIPIHVTQAVHHTNFQMILDDEPWGSTVTFKQGIPVELSGSDLYLDFAPGLDPAGLVGTTFRLFDWSGVTPPNDLNIVSEYDWDISLLYTDGTVTLLAVPEPGAFPALAALVLAAVGIRRRVN